MITNANLVWSNGNLARLSQILKRTKDIAHCEGPGFSFQQLREQKRHVELIYYKESHTILKE